MNHMPQCVVLSCNGHGDLVISPQDSEDSALRVPLSLARPRQREPGGISTLSWRMPPTSIPKPFNDGWKKSSLAALAKKFRVQLEITYGELNFVALVSNSAT